MTDYANFHFKHCIPDKNINEKIFTKNPAPSNLQGLLELNDFVKTRLVSQTAITTDQQMEKFQEKCCYHNSGKDWKMFETSLVKL